MFRDKKLSIFLVEDSEMYALMLDQTLKNKAIDHNLTVFNSGEECLKNLHFRPDVIFLDYYLPGINGMETLKKIKSSTEGKDIPVIIISGQKDIKLATELLKEGAEDYILKDEKATDKMSKMVNTL